MAKSLKDAGVTELAAFKRRVRRQLALGRIGQNDHDYLINQAELIEVRIVQMEETGGDESWS